MSATRALSVGEAAVARAGRFWLRWKYRLFQRGRHENLTLERVAGFPMVVLPGVFNPKLFWTGEFLADSLEVGLIPTGSSVLDLGTGSGIGAVAAARWARRVVAVDINPTALRCARINFLLNEVYDRVELKEGDLFAPVDGERFDVVLFNPPYYPGTPRNPLEHAFRGAGVAERFATRLADHLRPGGYALVLLSSAGESARFVGALRSAGMEVEPVAERSMVVETLILHRARLAC